MFEMILSQLINGLVLGSMYTLMATGLSLIYGIMRIINFSHGELYMLGGYVSFFMCVLGGFDPFTSTVLAMVSVFFIGVIVEKSITYPLRVRRGAGWEDSAYLALIGLMFFLQNLVLALWGGTWKGRYYPGWIVNVLGLMISLDRLLIIMVAVIIMAFLWFLIRKTMFGKAMRAIAQNKDAALLMGINVDKVYPLTFGLAAALAGGAGSLLAPIFMVYPTVGGVPLLKAFCVVILGGVGSIKGATLGGILLGITEALAIQYIGAEWKELISFVIIIFVLTFKPSGLFGVVTR